MIKKQILEGCGYYSNDIATGICKSEILLANSRVHTSISRYKNSIFSFFQFPHVLVYITTEIVLKQKN